MNKKGALPLVIGGVSVTTIVMILLWIFVIGPPLDDALEKALEKLGSDNLCPEEFNVDQYKICFNAQGDVIVDGIINEPVTVKIDGASNSCHIKSGQYDFEYSGCKLDQFKQLEAYNILLITNKGKVSLKGETLLKKIASNSDIVRISPKGVKWIKRLSYLLRFA